MGIVERDGISLGWGKNNETLRYTEAIQETTNYTNSHKLKK